MGYLIVMWMYRICDYPDVSDLDQLEYQGDIPFPCSSTLEWIQMFHASIPLATLELI